MVIHLSDGAFIEAFGDAARAVRIAGEEDERRVIALLCAEVNLWHASSVQNGATRAEERS
jgi:hypothetical protein